MCGCCLLSYLQEPLQYHRSCIRPGSRSVSTIPSPQHDHSESALRESLRKVSTFALQRLLIGLVRSRLLSCKTQYDTDQEGKHWDILTIIKLHLVTFRNLPLSQHVNMTVGRRCACYSIFMACRDTGLRPPCNHFCLPILRCQ